MKSLKIRRYAIDDWRLGVVSGSVNFYHWIDEISYCLGLYTIRLYSCAFSVARSLQRIEVTEGILVQKIWVCHQYNPSGLSSGGPKKGREVARGTPVPISFLFIFLVLRIQKKLNRLVWHPRFQENKNYIFHNQKLHTNPLQSRSTKSYDGRKVTTLTCSATLACFWFWIVTYEKRHRLKWYKI